MNDHGATGPNAPAQPEGNPATDHGGAAPAVGRAARKPPAPELAAPATTTGELPKIAEKADDLEAIRKAVEGAAAISGGTQVEDLAAVGGGWWLSYLFVLFYLAIAAGAVTHADLFFENPVKLPFLNIALPLIAFFFLAPILFLFVHTYTLVQLVMLTDKAKRFHQALHAEIGDEDGLPEDECARRAEIRAGLQRRLPNNIFVQFLAGPAEVRDSAFGGLLRAIAWATLVVAPVLLLLLIQIQFLPFHDSFITWTHRIVLAADLALIWWLWRKILSGREIGRRRRRASWAWPALGAALSAGAVLFSWTTATFPGEWQEGHLPSWWTVPVRFNLEHPRDESGRPKVASIHDPITALRDWVFKSEKVSLHDWLFNGPVDDISRRRTSLFSNTLILPGLNVYEGLGIDDPEKAKWRDFLFRARGRDLKGAILDFASLPRVDFTSAKLDGASLVRAQLRDATLRFAQLQGASLDQAQLQGDKLDLGYPFNRTGRFVSKGDSTKVAPSWADVRVVSAAWEEQPLGSGS